MKQRTALESSNLLALTRSHIRRRVLTSLRPEGAMVPLDLDLLDVMSELDPGMIPWEHLVKRPELV